MHARYIFSGFSDYWSGYSCSDTERLLYAFYGPYTSLREVIDQLVEDSYTGPSSESLQEVTDSDVRLALLSMLSSDGLHDYYYGNLLEFAKDCEDCEDCESLVFIVVLTL